VDSWLIWDREEPSKSRCGTARPPDGWVSE
jgi:hypothetical protein